MHLLPFRKTVNQSFYESNLELIRKILQCINWFIKTTSSWQSPKPRRLMMFIRFCCVAEFPKIFVQSWNVRLKFISIAFWRAWDMEAFYFHLFFSFKFHVWFHRFFWFSISFFILITECISLANNLKFFYGRSWAHFCFNKLWIGVLFSNTAFSIFLYCINFFLLCVG